MRRLVVVWLVLMGLTLVTGLANAALDESQAPAIAVGVLALVTVAKARLILARYLRLSQAPSFLSGFTTAVVIVVAVVALSVVAIRHPLAVGTPGATAPTLHLPSAHPLKP